MIFSTLLFFLFSNQSFSTARGSQAKIFVNLALILVIESFYPQIFESFGQSKNGCFHPSAPSVNSIHSMTVKVMKYKTALAKIGNNKVMKTVLLAMTAGAVAVASKIDVFL